MLVRLLLLFIVVPLVELTLLLVLANAISIPWTLAIVVATGITGTLLARSQGFRVWGRIQQELAQGRMPTTALVDGAMVLVAGALLLTPGVLTDIFGISLLLPPCRHYYRQALMLWFRRRFHVTVEPLPGDPNSPGTAAEPPRPEPSRIIDTRVIDPDEDEP